MDRRVFDVEDFRKIMGFMHCTSCLADCEVEVLQKAYEAVKKWVVVAFGFLPKDREHTIPLEKLKTLEAYFNQRRDTSRSTIAVLSYDLIEDFSPVTKKKAIFISSKWSVYQPEIIRHKNRIISYKPPEPTSKQLLIMAAPQNRPYPSSSEFLQFTQVLKNVAPKFFDQVDILFVSPYFGPIPLELSSLYPFAQNEIPQTNLLQDPAPLVELVIQYISKNSQYRNFMGIFPPTSFWKGFVRRCSRKVKQQKKDWHTIYTNFRRITLTESMKRTLRLW